MPSPIGHALGGAAVAWLCDLVPGRRSWRTAAAEAPWFKRAGNGLTAVCAVLAAAPDLDLLFDIHRTYTHSIGAIVFVGLFAGALAANANRPALRVAVMCAAAFASHVLLDWLAADSYPPRGIQALWPFDDSWYYSGWDVFLQTERNHPLSASAMRVNIASIVREVLVMGPIAVGVWLVRAKALARASTKA